MSKLCLSLLNWAPPSAHWVLMGSLLWWQLQSNHNNMVKYHIQDQLPSVLKFVLRGQEGHFNMVETCRRVGSLTGDTWGDVQHPLLGTILPIMPLGPHHDCHLIPAPSIRQSISPLCPTGVTTTPSEIGMLQSPSPHTHTVFIQLSPALSFYSILSQQYHKKESSSAKEELLDDVHLHPVTASVLAAGLCNENKNQL